LRSITLKLAANAVKHRNIPLKQLLLQMLHMQQGITTRLWNH
jgi:hypothetical protein